ncbi:M14 family metallopeptidase [Deltaproteobacteria bacterium TL4]
MQIKNSDEFSTLFLNSLDSCQEAFLADVKSQGGDPIVEAYVPSTPELKTYYAYFPARKISKTLLILSSGDHGIEGFVGSAVQRLFLRKFMSKIDLDRTGVLLIHAVNPYGFQHFRRVTENNVDLNRNGLTDPEMFQTTKNEVYEELEPFLNPTEKYVPAPTFIRQTLELGVRLSAETLRGATVGGQYQFEKGIFFGGTTYEPQLLKLKELMTRFMSPYQVVMTNHLHTGYGKRYHLHLLQPQSSKIALKLTHLIFQDFGVNALRREKSMYQVKGSLGCLLGEWVTQQGKLYVPMFYEYGTLGTQTRRGLIESLRRMIVENQIFHYGCEDSALKLQALEQFKELFYPAEFAWRESVIKNTIPVFETLCERLPLIA